MTHRYTILRGGIVLQGADATTPTATAIAWAAGVVLAIGGDADVSAISRGDSRFVELGGASVIPLESAGVARWPTTAVLDVGGPADLAILADDPRAPAGAPRTARPGLPTPIAIVRAGRVVAGRLPGTGATRDPSGP